MTTPSVVLTRGGKKKITSLKIVATFVSASSQGQRTQKYFKTNKKWSGF
jgi:hypothetical protein